MNVYLTMEVGYSTEYMDIMVWMRTFLRSHFLRIFIIGGIGVFVQTIVFEILGIWLGLVQPSTATVLGAELGVVMNFLLNNRFSFTNSPQTSLGARLLRFHLVVAVSIVIQWLFVFTAEHVTSNLLVLHGAYVAGIVIGFLSNYIGYHLFVWKQEILQPK